MDINEFWQPFEKEIESYNDLVKVINTIMSRSNSNDRQFAWRGQVDACWALHSSLYRRCLLTKGSTLAENELAEEEEKILIELHRWGLHAPNHTGRLSILSQLAMLQHYGAPTRLIDISFNAWIGVWFAVEQKWNNGEVVNENDDGRLFAIDVTDRLINESNYRQWEDDLHRPWGENASTPVDEKEWTTSVYAWKPPSIDARISAQNGGFLLGGVAGSMKPDGNRFQFPKGPQNQWWALDDGRAASCFAFRPHKFERSRGVLSPGALYTFRIKAAAKPEIRAHLEKMFGYKYQALYPDYTGFSNFGIHWLKK